MAIGYRRRREGEHDARNLGGVAISQPRRVAVSFEARDRVVVR